MFAKPPKVAWINSDSSFNKVKKLDAKKRWSAMIDQSKSRGRRKTRNSHGSFRDSLRRERAARCLRHSVRMDLSPRTLVNSPSTSCFFARRYPVRRVASRGAAAVLSSQNATSHRFLAPIMSQRRRETLISFHRAVRRDINANVDLWSRKNETVKQPVAVPIFNSWGKTRKW